MGRKKIAGPEELLKSMNEGTEEKTRPYIDIKSLAAEEAELEALNEADDVELDEGDSDPDKTTELDLTSESKRKSAAKKPRIPRKRKEPAIVDEDITAVLEPKLEAAPKKEIKKEAAAKAVIVETLVTEPVTAVVSKPQFHHDDHLREDASIASASLHKTMESMVKQWGSVKEISGSICSELERVNTMLKMPAPQAEPADIKEYLKQAAPRITLANKIALGVSAAAVVFSILSLSLASSTRHRLLEQSSVPAVAFERRQEKPQPVRPVQQAPVAVAKPTVVEAPVVAHTTPPPVVPAIEKTIPKASPTAKEWAASELSRQPLLSPPKARARKPVALAKAHGRTSHSRRAR